MVAVIYLLPAYFIALLDGKKQKKTHFKRITVEFFLQTDLLLNKQCEQQLTFTCDRESTSTGEILSCDTCDLR